MDLPPFAKTQEEALAHLQELGFARLAGALTADELERARERLATQAKREAEIGHAHFDGWGEELIAQYAPDRLDQLPPGPNQRVWNLVNKGEIFRRLVLKERTLGLVKALLGDSVLGDDVLLSSFTANIACKGGAPMGLPPSWNRVS